MNSSEAANTPPKRGDERSAGIECGEEVPGLLGKPNTARSDRRDSAPGGLYSTDLARIRQQVKEGAIQRLGAKPGRKAEVVSADSYEELKRTASKRNGRWPISRSSWRSCEKNDGVRGPIAGHRINAQNQTGILT